MEDLKERIEKKLEEHLEKILAKDELTNDDVMRLDNMLYKLEQKDSDERWKNDMATLLDIIKR